MCEFENGMKFCTCEANSIKFRGPRTFRRIDGKLEIVVAPKDKKIPLEYIWELFRFEGKVPITEIGRYMMPINDLGKGLNAEWIALNLNCEDCFDFEYTPNEGDSLKISENVTLGPYISFVFRDKEWTIDHHYPWSTQISDLKKGRVKAVQ